MVYLFTGKLISFLHVFIEKNHFLFENLFTVTLLCLENLYQGKYSISTVDAYNVSYFDVFKRCFLCTVTSFCEIHVAKVSIGLNLLL